MTDFFTETSVQPIPIKEFARPFRLVFETDDGKTTRIEVRTLAGLKEVMRRREEGKIVERFGYSLEIQLWGHLASYCGFLRVKVDNDGLQPLGEGFADLSEELSAIFGDEDKALKTLDEMRSLAVGKPREPTRTDGKFVKGDAVNLTTAGEQKLAEIVGEPLDPLHKQVDAAVSLYSQTEPEEIDTDTAIRDAQLADGTAEPKTVPPERAKEIGQRVEEAAPRESTDLETKD